MGKKKNEINSLAAHSPPPAPRCSFGENKNKNHIYMSRCDAGLDLSRVRTSIPSTRRLGHNGCRFAKFYASVCGNNFSSLVASLFSWRYLAASTSSFLHAAMNLRPPSVTVSTHTSAFNAVAFQSPLYQTPGCRSVRNRSTLLSPSHPVLSSSRPLRTAPSRFPNTIRLGSRPPLIWMSISAHKSLLVRSVVSMLSHRVISRARLYEIIRWSGLLRCGPMMRSKTRWCKVRSLAYCSWRSHVLHPYRRASIALAFTIRVLRESAPFGWS